MKLSYNTELKNAITYYSNGNIPEARSSFGQLIVSFPNKLNSYYYLAEIEAKFYNDIKRAIELMTKAVEIAPFYEGYKELTEYNIIEKNLPEALKYAKQALIYNCRDDKILSFLKNFPKEANYVRVKDTIINGEYQHSKDYTQLKYHKIYDAGTIERKAPRYLEELLTDNQKRLLNQAIEQNYINNYQEGFVLKIPDGRAFIKQSDQTYIITPDNKILKDMLVDGCPELSVKMMPNEVRCADKLLVLSSCWGGNFYHWLTWVVPRICMVEQAGYNLKDFDKIAINYLGFEFQRNLLELLGIPKNKIIGTIENGAVLRAKTLVTASLPSHLHTPQIVTDSLRKTFLKPEYKDESSPKLIYLSRNKSTSRFVVNEDEVYSYLQKIGFTIIYPEDYSFEQQVRIFTNANVIISAHGAGLVNLSFCKPNTKVIEVYNEFFRNAIDTSFFRICNNVKLDHYFMFGEPIVGDKLLNMNIDIIKLSKVLEFAGIESKQFVPLESL